jgi:hypothetical protein
MIEYNKYKICQNKCCNDDILQDLVFSILFFAVFPPNFLLLRHLCTFVQDFISKYYLIYDIIKARISNDQSTYKNFLLLFYFPRKKYTPNTVACHGLIECRHSDFRVFVYTYFAQDFTWEKLLLEKSTEPVIIPPLGR